MQNLDRQKVIYEDSVGMNKFTGTFQGLRALTKRFFAWNITSKASNIELVFQTNVSESVTFDGVASLGDLKVLYDPDIHNPLNAVEYTVDTFGEKPGAIFDAKQPRYEEFINKYIVSDFIASFVYT